MNTHLKTLTLVVTGTVVGLMAGAASASLTGLNVLLGTGPTIGGGGPYTQIGIGGFPTEGLASSVIIERTGQRSGNATDDGPALVVKELNNTSQLGAARFESSKGVVVEAVGQGGSVFRHPGVRNTPGDKTGLVALTSIGGLVIKGKDVSGATELDSVRLVMNNGQLLAIFANGNAVVLATETD